MSWTVDGRQYIDDADRRHWFSLSKSIRVELSYYFDDAHLIWPTVPCNLWKVKLTQSANQMCREHGQNSQKSDLQITYFACTIGTQGQCLSFKRFHPAVSTKWPSSSPQRSLKRPWPPLIQLSAADSNAASWFLFVSTISPPKKSAIKEPPRAKPPSLCPRWTWLPTQARASSIRIESTVRPPTITIAT